MKSNKKCSKCNANKKIYLRPPLLVNTVRSPGNHLQKFIRTATDGPHVLSLSIYFIADYDNKKEILT